MPISPEFPLILASMSPYRMELLSRLKIPFTHESPHVDESPLPNESADRLARRLADLKADAIAARYPERWVLGCDQTADCDGQLLGKPGSVAAAVDQLALCSGKTVSFHTAVTLSCRDADQSLRALVPTLVRFRSLSRAEIRRYVQLEPALDCAGGFKVEGLGIGLFEAVESSDPTALIGLPLIATRELLQRIGYSLLGPGGAGTMPALFSDWPAIEADSPPSQ